MDILTAPACADSGYGLIRAIETGKGNLPHEIIAGDVVPVAVD